MIYFINNFKLKDKKESETKFPCMTVRLSLKIVDSKNGSIWYRHVLKHRILIGSIMNNIYIRLRQ